VPVPGVGKKTAARLLIELKSRLDIPLDIDASTVAGPTGDGSGSSRADVREALTGLGYGTEEIRDVLADLPDADDPGALLKQALQRLAVAR
jgi:Holliday junction DNA helicase RuvA